jgi:MSHA biogenesis protein MshK
MAHDLTSLSLCGFVAALAGAGVGAETLPDPTRPPAFLFAPVDGEAAAAEAAKGGLVLQSVLIAPGRRTAIIGGRHVTIGERLGDFTLVRVDETEVQLRGPEGSRTLKLFPDSEKRLARAAVATQGTAPRAPGDAARP